MIRRQIQFLVLEGKYVRFFGKDSGDRSAKQLALGKVYQNLWDGGRLIGGGGILDASRGGGEEILTCREEGGKQFWTRCEGRGRKILDLTFLMCVETIYMWF